MSREEQAGVTEEEREPSAASGRDEGTGGREGQSAAEEAGHLFLRLRQSMREGDLRPALYVIGTVLVTYFLLKGVDHLPQIAAGLGRGLHYLGAVLRPLVLGLVVAYLLYPVEEFLRVRLDKLKWLEKRRHKGRPAAVLITYLLLGSALVLLLSLLASALTHEITVINLDGITGLVEETGDSLKSLYRTVQTALAQLNMSSAELDDVVQKIGTWFSQQALKAGNQVLNSLSHLTAMLGNAMFALILSIYFMLDAQGIRRYWGRVLLAVVGDKGYHRTQRVLKDIDHVFSGYIRGQIMDALFMLVAVSVLLSLLHVKFAMLIGVLTGIGNLIPYVGPFFAYGGTVFSCVLTGDWKKLIGALVAIFVLQTIDGNVVGPKLMSHSIHVHPMLVIVALIAGGAVGGLFGMLLAVPVAALLKLWFDRVISWLVARRVRAKRTGAKEEKS